MYTFSSFKDGEAFENIRDFEIFQLDLIFFGFRISFSTYAMRRFKRLHDLPLTFASQFAGVKETA